MSDELLFAPEEGKQHDTAELIQNTWKVLIVDDDKEVHSFTRLALHDFTYSNRPLEISSAFSAKEAKQALTNGYVAVVLLDIVMESSDAGLQVVEYIRHKLKDHLVRIIIRTGQPGEAPERYVIDHYDINDYKEKTELTTERLYTTMRTALSQYKQIIELENRKNELYHSLHVDSLTGLPNRLKLTEDLDTGTVMSLILINIDGFSMTNDAYGFEIGDQLLIQVSEKLQTILKQFELTLYHLNADIFAVLIPSDLCEHTDQVVNKTRLDISEHIFMINLLELRLNVTIGVVINEVGNMIQKAEIALREARTISRNRVQYYSHDLEIINAIHENNKWTKWLHDALIDDKILAYYQPIIDPATREIHKYEALVRLEHEDITYSPFSFLTAARHAGLLHQITRRIVDKSFAKFKDNNINFSINLADIDLMEKDFIPYLEEKRREYDIAATRVSFELLEDSTLLEIPVIQKHLFKLIDLGYGISIDDFGVRCSNFARLGSFPLETLKIDGSFIQNIDTNEHSHLVTESILLFAKKKKIKTVAEFVHSEAIFEIVKAMGVDYVQGYYLGEPKADLI
jgi:diguanylate cyclase (GGDEF)-like protein